MSKACKDQQKPLLLVCDVVLAFSNVFLTLVSYKFSLNFQLLYIF